MIKIVSCDADIIQDLSDLIRKHGNRVGAYAKLLAVRARFVISQEDADTVFRAARLHDIGKDHMPQALWQKKGPLTPIEKTAMCEHVLIGREFIGSAKMKKKDKLFWSMAKDACLYHHEWWNGNGYFAGLSGESIPMIARIVAIADSYDVMTSERTYKIAKTSTQAFEEIQNCAGTQFDPKLAELFCNYSTEVTQIQRNLNIV